MKKWIWGIIALLLVGLVFVVSSQMKPEEDENAVPEIKIKWKMTSQTSVRIKWSGGRKLKYWRIRQSVINDDGEMSDYETVIVLKRSKKSYTIKNLKENTGYAFEITGGIRKSNGKYKPTSTYEYIWSFYTGISQVVWDDYASTDAFCSPNKIQLLGTCYNDGLPINGFEIYRKGSKESQYSKIATIKNKDYYFSYMDKEVAKGETYQYKFRAYGIINKKTMYSPFSEVMERSATYQNGRFTSKMISASKKELVIKLTSAKYNADLEIEYGDLHLMGKEIVSGLDWYDTIDLPAVNIVEYSHDHKKWTKLSKNKSVYIKGGTSIYLKLKSDDNDVDMRKGSELIADDVSYEGLPCFFEIVFDGEGETSHNDEMIH